MPQDLLRQLHERARGQGARVALPEAEDPRVQEAAVRARQSGLAEPILLGEPATVRRTAKTHGISLEGLPIQRPEEDPEILEALRAALEARHLSFEPRRSLILDPLHYAGLMVRSGRADGCIMGAVATTADTLRAALNTVGVAPRFEVVTSCFLMCLPDGRVLVYADCGVVPQPTPTQLADIAIQAAEAFRLLVGGEPRVALLAFSTKGSAQHASLDGVRQAVGELAERRVDFLFDGELQGDAALVAGVAARKAPDSPVAGSANVLIFPDLHSGNIAYKLTERLAGARAIGPLLRGLDGPVHDLSRGCSTQDILDTIAITALDAVARRQI